MPDGEAAPEVAKIIIPFSVVVTGMFLIWSPVSRGIMSPSATVPVELALMCSVVLGSVVLIPIFLF